MLTAYHAKYFAHELTKRHSADDPEKLAGTLVDAQVDLNPHQVDAAMFAFGSPLSKGALLADEVGLGKTIEAGLVISQRWAERKRRILVHECDVHTLLRLPTGLFYAQGVKANILFFDKKPASETPWTKQLWIYDFRTNQNFTLKTNQIKRNLLDEFVSCYHPESRFERTPTWSDTNPEGRWRTYSYEELIARDKANLDIFWLRDESLEDSANLPAPEVLAQEIADDLEAALEQIRGVLNGLE